MRSFSSHNSYLLCCWEDFEMLGACSHILEMKHIIRTRETDRGDSASKTSEVARVRISYAQRPKWLLKFSGASHKTPNPKCGCGHTSPTRCWASDGTLCELCQRKRIGASEWELLSFLHQALSRQCARPKDSSQTSLFRKLDQRSRSYPEGLVFRHQPSD